MKRNGRMEGVRDHQPGGSGILSLESDPAGWIVARLRAERRVPLVAYVSANGIICAGVATVGKRRPTLVPAWLSSLALALPMFRSDFPARQILADRSTLKAE